VAQQRDEIISEAEARKLTKKDKDYYINYKTYVDINDKISIRHYDEKSDKLELSKPVSGANELVENGDHENMSGGIITNGKENTNSLKEIDTEFLLRYFQDHGIKQISLTPEGKLLIEYNDGRTEIGEKTNNQEFQKLISYYQKSGQTSLNQKDLINLNDTTNSSQLSPSNSKSMLVGALVGGTLIIGIVVGILMMRKKSKKNK